jgi:hypothetical protein
MRILRLLLAALLLPAAAVAQGAQHGRVLDAVSGRPVLGAVVRGSDGRAAAVTDSAGRFTLRLAADSLSVYRLGYDTLNASVGRADSVQLQLTPRTLRLAGVPVSGARIGRSHEGAVVPWIAEVYSGQLLSWNALQVVEDFLGPRMSACSAPGQGTSTRYCAALRGSSAPLRLYVDGEARSAGLGELAEIPAAEVAYIQLLSSRNLVLVVTNAAAESPVGRAGFFIPPP